MSRFIPKTERFEKEHEILFYAELDKFPTIDDVYFTDTLKELIDLIISIVISKKKWAYTTNDNYLDEDLIQHIYTQVPRLLRNVYTRYKSTDNKINSLFSYLFAAIEKKGWTFKNKENYQVTYVPDMRLFVDVLQEAEELYTDHIPDVYSEISYRELEYQFEEKLDNITFNRVYDTELLACYWLLDCYKTKLSICFEDLWPFLYQLPLEKRMFIYDYVDVKIRAALYDFKRQRNPPEEFLKKRHILAIHGSN